MVAGRGLRGTGRQPIEAGGAAEAFVEPLDRIVDRRARIAIEALSARIDARCSLAEVLADPLFLEDPSGHVALFPDHGVVHGRDVARQVLQVLDTASGRLIPGRDPGRLGWMKRYGVLLAYLHDIGMVDVSAAGRAMHPEFAAQAALGPAFDPIVALLEGDRAGIAARLEGLPAPRAVLRELLAMACCHSKSKVPVAVLNDPSRLRAAMRAATGTDLATLYRVQRGEEVDAALRMANGFGWLEAADGPGKALVEDVVDTLRVLRCADALRQRGTALKTSGGYEVFVDARSGNAVFALRPDPGRLWLLEVDDPIVAGEANVAASQLDRDGNLRIAFHHGAFRDTATTRAAARNAALMVSDIQADAIGSFARADAAAHPELRAHGELAILLEAVPENPGFAPAVAVSLATLDPAAGARVRVVAAPTAGAAAAAPRAGTPVAWDRAQRVEVLEQLGRVGLRTLAIDPAAAFHGARIISLTAGERLIAAGTAPDFVYVPLGSGVRGLPLGGYAPFAVPAWVPVGITGVIRGAARNSDVYAEQAMQVLAIPKETFLAHWPVTYNRQGFAALFRGPEQGGA